MLCFMSTAPYQVPYFCPSDQNYGSLSDLTSFPCGIIREVSVVFAQQLDLRWIISAELEYCACFQAEGIIDNLIRCG